MPEQDDKERGRLAKDNGLTHEDLVDLAKVLESRGYSNASIGHILRIPESVAKSMVETSK